MAESTLEAPPIPESAVPDQTPPPETVPWTLRKFVREHPWWTVTVVLLIFSTILVVWARTRPSFDAYGWLVWGYQAIHGNLDLGGAPSWKPLPFVFTVPFALFGHYQLWLWMITDVAVSLAGCIFAARIAYRLTGDQTEHRYAAIAAAIFAGVALLGLEDYMHYILSAQSDPMIVTLVLAAIDMHLIGRRRLAFAMLVLASLGRPEVWPFLGLYSVWLWLRVPSARWLIYLGLFVVAFMWFGIPWITNGRPLVSAQLAQNSPRELHSNKITGTIDRFKELYNWPIWLAGALTVAVAVWRRNRVIMALAAGVVLWVIVETAFAIHGWPALPRYMFEAAAVVAVFAGVGVGWVLLEAPRLWSRLPRWAGVPVVAVLVGVLVPGAIARVKAERTDRHHEVGRTHQIALLQTTTNLLGGSRHITNCGQPVTDVAYVSALAWLYHRDVGSVGGLQQHVERIELRKPIPKVLFTPLPGGGWKVLPWHTRGYQIARCHTLHAAYVVSRSHPGGVLLRGR